MPRTFCGLAAPPQDYTGNAMTGDGQYRTPTGSYSLPLKSCYKTEIYSNTASASAYAMNLGVDASMSMSASYMGITGAFSASAGYKHAEAEARQSSSYRFDSRSYCNKYFAAWINAIPKGGELQPAFLEQAGQAIDALHCMDPKTDSLTEDELQVALLAWQSLFSNFGTQR